MREDRRYYWRSYYKNGIVLWLIYSYTKWTRISTFCIFSNRYLIAYYGRKRIWTCPRRRIPCDITHVYDRTSIFVYFKTSSSSAACSIYIYVQIGFFLDNKSISTYLNNITISNIANPAVSRIWIWCSAKNEVAKTITIIDPIGVIRIIWFSSM